MTIQTEPTRDRRAAKASVETAPKPVEKRPAVPSRSRTAAAQRAYARRAQRDGRRIERPVEDDLDTGAGRASFVVSIIVVLAVGVAATLWLSTQAIADSYRLDKAKQDAERLAERAGDLEREVTEMESAATLAERAKAMGMVPSGDPARLVVHPDGTVTLVGEPTPAQAPPSTSASADPAAGNQQQQGEQPAGAGQGTG